MSTDPYAAHGIRPSDEGPHPHDPADVSWNESWFHDWTSADGTEAGHCRIGWMPARAQVWVWLFLRRGDAWYSLECCDLPAASFSPATQQLKTPSLTLSRTVLEPLHTSTLSVQAMLRRRSGPDTDEHLPASVQLRFEAVAPPHSPGESVLGEHAGVPLTTNRFEQPVKVSGTISIGGNSIDFSGRGERDHSWGPRDWRMHWTFVTLNGEERQLQAADVELFPGMCLQLGYLQDATGGHEIAQVAFDLDWPDDPIHPPKTGRLNLKTDDGNALCGTITALGSTPIDLSAVLKPAWRYRYHRSQIRFVPADGGAPVIGWLEHCRFIDGLAAVLDEAP